MAEGLSPLNVALTKALDERARYRTALERIRDHGVTDDDPCHAVFSGDCADVMRETARAALAAEE